MARVELTLTTTSRSGVAGTYAAFNTGDGNYFVNNQNTVLHVKNNNAANRVIHIISQATVDGKPVKDQVVTVPNGTERFIGPFSNAVYGSSGQVSVDCYDENGITFDDTTDVASGTKNSTSVTVAAIVIGSL